MPKFSHKKGGQGGGGGQPPYRPQAPAQRTPSPVKGIQKIVEPRCHVCQSPHRDLIDRMLVLGTPYLEISRALQMEIDRRSISNHDKNHLALEDHAVRRILEAEAVKHAENIEDGIQGVITRRAALDIAIGKWFQDLAEDNIEIETKDAIAMIQLRDKLDGDTAATQVEEVKLQFQALLQAMKEVLQPEQLSRILTRGRELYDALSHITQVEKNVDELES